MADPFYQLCYNLEDAGAIVSRLHHALLMLSVLFIAVFISWAILRFRREEEHPTGLETALQVFVVVLGLANQSAVLYSFAAYRDTITNVFGARNPETIWTLGQIMGMSAWIPIVVSFFYIVSSQRKFSRALIPSVTHQECRGVRDDLELEAVKGVESFAEPRRDGVTRTRLYHEYSCPFGLSPPGGINCVCVCVCVCVSEPR